MVIISIDRNKTHGYGITLQVDISQPIVINGNKLKACMSHAIGHVLEEHVKSKVAYMFDLSDGEMMEFKRKYQDYKNGQKFDTKIQSILEE